MTHRLLIAATLAVVALVCTAGPSYAADLVVDSTDLALTAGSPATVEIPVLNVSNREIRLAPTVADQPGCSVTALPESVAAGRRAAVTFTFAAGCDTANGVTLAIAGTTAAGPPLVVAKAPSGAATLSGLALGFGLSALALLALAVWAAKVLQGVQGELKSGTVQTRIDKDYERLLQRIKDAFEAAGKPQPGKNQIPTKPPLPEMKAKAELVNLEAGWSFKDSWVANLNLGSAAFVALVASSDVLTAVLGIEPKKGLGVMTIAAGCAALLVALSSALVKVVGKNLKKPTVAGLLGSAALVLFGTNGQIWVIAVEALRLFPSTPWRVAIVTLALAVTGLVGWYGVRSIASLVRQGLSLADPAEPSAEVQAAWIMVGADAQAPREIRLSPLEVSQIIDTYSKTPPGKAPKSADLRLRHPMSQQRASMI